MILLPLAISALQFTIFFICPPSINFLATNLSAAISVDVTTAWLLGYGEGRTFDGFEDII